MVPDLAGGVHGHRATPIGRPRSRPHPDRRVGRRHAGTAIAYAAGWPTRFFNPLRLQMQPVDTTNFLYLSTFTRCSGLLLGAAMAFLWRPWTAHRTPRAHVGSMLDRVAATAVAALVLAFVLGRVASGSTYLFVLPMVTISSAALVAVVVHPWASGARAIFGSRPMVEIGKRSYGLYLWTWPVSRICNAYTGSWPRFAAGRPLSKTISASPPNSRYRQANSSELAFVGITRSSSPCRCRILAFALARNSCMVLISG